MIKINYENSGLIKIVGSLKLCDKGKEQVFKSIKKIPVHAQKPTQEVIRGIEIVTKEILFNIERHINSGIFFPREKGKSPKQDSLTIYHHIRNTYDS